MLQPVACPSSRRWPTPASRSTSATSAGAPARRTRPSSTSCSTAARSASLGSATSPTSTRRSTTGCSREASRLTGAERYRAYGKLDVELSSDAAPAIPFAVVNALAFVSKRRGLRDHEPHLDLTAVCLNEARARRSSARGGYALAPAREARRDVAGATRSGWRSRPTTSTRSMPQSPASPGRPPSCDSLARASWERPTSRFPGVAHRPRSRDGLSEDHERREDVHVHPPQECALLHRRARDGPRRSTHDQPRPESIAQGLRTRRI